MSLVSYVDILEVVGNLQDFRKRLIEGETIANENRITEASKIRIEKSGWEVLAKCKAQLDDVTDDPLSVRICCTAKPRNLKCSCSCNHEISSKCKHVIATLIFLNRKNSSAELREAEVQYAEAVNNRKSPCRKEHLKKPVTPTRQSQRSRKFKNDKAYVSVRNVNASARAGGRGPENFETVEPIKEQIKCEDDLTDHHQDEREADFQNIIICQEASSDEDKPLPDRKKIIGLKQKKTTKHSETEKFGELQPSKSKRQRVQPNLPQRSSTLPTAECPSPEDFSEGSARSFPCDVCGKIFERKASLANHLRHHLICKAPCKTCNKKPAPSKKDDEDERDVPENCCDESEQPVHTKEEHEHAYQDCAKSFSSKRNLDLHIREHEQDSDHRYTCEICGKTFRKKSQLTEHKRTHDKASRPQYQCTKCGKCYVSKRSFLAHANCDRVSKPPLPEGVKRRTIVNCQVCGKGFSNRMHHEEHVRSHTGERPFQCLECGKGFASKRSLRNHSHDGPAARDRPFLCAQCPAKFATAFMLKTHSRTHTDEKPWVCSECGKGYRSQHVLIDHQNQHRGIKAHTCKECGKKFTWRTSLWAHSRDHTRNKPFECVQCGATFAEQLELKEHWVEHSDDKPYQCSECGIGYLLEEARDKHMETHKKEATHTCPVCNESFTRADMLLQHSQIHKEPRTCLCPHCGKTFSNKGHLRVHMMIHSGEKPFECETCQKRFYTRSLLRKHAVFHSSERPFECTMCGDRFPTQGILKAHIRIHTGEKPFTCKTCGKSFTQSTYLKRHSMTHSGERPYPCTVCDSAFTSRYDLKVHMRVHTGEKPFACDECSERFYERSTLTIHRRVHTGELPFRCDQCEKAFNTRNHFRKHFARAHPDVAPFACETCPERFSLCEELRKHRKSVHLVSNSTDPMKATSTEVPIVMPTATPTATSTTTPKDPLECLIQDSEILQDDPPLPKVEHSIAFQVPVVVNGSSIVDGGPIVDVVGSAIVNGGPIVNDQVIEIVPVTEEPLPLNLESVDPVQVYEEHNVEYGQILRSTLLR